MAKSPPAHDWFLVPWLKSFRKRQSDLVADLGWNPSKASLCWRHEQRYHRDDINEIAAYLGIQPFELLMHPDEANAIKSLRIAAKQIAAADLLENAGRGTIAKAS